MNKIARDYLGKEIHLGDKVVFVQLGYRNFWKGTISRITKCTVIIDHQKTNMCSTQTKQNHNQVIVINK